jgi:hypothetical protein
MIDSLAAHAKRAETGPCPRSQRLPQHQRRVFLIAAMTGLMVYTNTLEAFRVAGTVLLFYEKYCNNLA